MTLAVAKSCGPGRPKDLEKRAAILAAAKRLFPLSGFEGTSMDAIAAEAGVSKLTVYSHFTDKETLFVAAIRARCTDQVPDALFDVDTSGPVRGQLEAIARAFLALITSPEAISLHRLLTSSGSGSPKLGQLFWEAGPLRMRQSFEQFLTQEVEAGKLDIPDITRAASQFFALLKGELHARLLCGCTQSITLDDIDEHVAATVDMFLRAWAPRAANS
ncbi:MAG TPA: TetR/AcrR family transcriptional regulator [Rhodanobacteraceae bacterium]|jgi:TetR/AcrR family transcriptional repressor of mexJK operon|nr:TetR/AcrR family transcriptional regulator [Rhodanobacteraceae bacterium]